MGKPEMPDEMTVGKIEQLTKGAGLDPDRQFTPEYVDQQRQKLVETQRYENIMETLQMMLQMITKLYFTSLETTDQEVLQRIEEKMELLQKFGNPDG